MKRKNSARGAKESFVRRLRKDLRKNYVLYLMILPIIVLFICFSYKPMYGVLMAFYNYNVRKGFAGSTFVGFQHFETFIKSFYFERTVTNTLMINIGLLLFSFPAPIILALLMNEVRSKKYKKIVQTVTYLPHFISIVIICGMLSSFCLSTGLFNDIIVAFGGERESLLQNPDYYRTIYIASTIWREVGWGSIIYLAALSGVDMQLYEAAVIDGAGKWKQMIHVTLPCILPTIAIKLILQIGGMMTLGYEKTLLLYNPSIYSTADIISTYVFREGMENPGRYGQSYATAVELFNSIINLILVFTANKVSKKVTESSLW